MQLKLILIVVSSLVTVCMCDHLVMGDVTGKQMIHHTVVQYSYIPFSKRVKNVFYNDQNQRIINSILVYDNLHSKASATVTAGGIGFTYVNIRLKSERGTGLDYDVGLYT